MFRFGGEEFTILVERTSEGGAASAFERLRATIEAYKFPQVGRVTISAGMTRIEHDEASMSAFERADEALYFAKNHGRNQVHCYERLVAASLLRARQHQLDIEMF
jgi:diguanylate cyclase (GGDEF)-like protein